MIAVIAAVIETHVAWMVANGWPRPEAQRWACEWFAPLTLAAVLWP